MNNPTLNEQDPGHDGYETSTNDHLLTARDAYGFHLSYFEGDYQGISGHSVLPEDGTPLTGVDLYNGNIGRMITTITNPTSREVLPLVNLYSYDQLNRLVLSHSYEAIDAHLNTWNDSGEEEYRNEFVYDANGNILTQNRWNASSSSAFDKLDYKYRKNSDGKILQNRLYHVKDNSSDTTPNELTDQEEFNPGDENINSNYIYDAEGRLIADAQEKIGHITWRVDGKVKEIQRGEGSGRSNLRFDYDAMGHRIAKHVYDDTWHLQKSTYYVLDAQGNAMGVYERAVDDESSIVTFALKEQYIYGSNRIGVKNTDVNLLSTTMTLPVSNYQSHDIGKKTFELTNHLGNVLSTISDKPIPYISGETVSYYMADIRSCSDYYGFGSEMRERTMTLAGADRGRFGFQNQEMDDEIKGEGNSVNYTFRMHDPRLGRFFAVDPLVKKYPYYSPYQFGGNQVISSIELEGLEPSEDANKVDDPNKQYQATDKSAENDHTVYNWKSVQGTNGTRQWIMDGTKYTGPTPEEDAQMADDVYKINRHDHEIWDYKIPNTDYRLRKKYNDINGFKAALYSREIDGEVFYVLAFAGTENVLDAITDIVSGVGFESNQLAEAVSVSTRVNTWVTKQNNGDHLHFTGHSLGGGLAAISSFATGRTATTFNAMGLGANLEVSYTGSIYQMALIQSYIIYGEPVDMGQFSKADGTQHKLASKPGAGFIDKHMMKQFLNRKL